MAAFQLWRDYFQLSRVVQEMRWRSARSSWPGAFAHQAPEAPPGVERRPARPCAFCKHNGESRAIYESHSLKDSAGRVQCPILRSYTCPQCGASQDLAHTRKFCPLTNKGYTSVYSCLRNSAGKKKRRFPTWWYICSRTRASPFPEVKENFGSNTPQVIGMQESTKMLRCTLEKKRRELKIVKDGNIFLKWQLVHHTWKQILSALITINSLILFFNPATLPD